MIHLAAKVLTANRPNGRYFIAVRVKREKHPSTGKPKGRREFENSVALPGTSDVFRRFDRETKELAGLVLSAVASVALVFAVLVQERHPKRASLREETRESGGYLLLNDNLRPGAASQYEQTVQMNSGQATSVDHVYARLFDKQLNNRTVHAP